MEATRRRNAAATREAILASARQAFARSGYDGAGVREIAKGAGVTAMLVNRYFGSKEQLFAEVIASIMASPDILAAEVLASPDVAAGMAATLVEITKAGATPLDGFLVMLHSASSQRAAELGREQIERHYHRVLTEALRGDDAPQRAALLLALVAGVQVMRQVIALGALADADPDTLVKLLTPLFQHLLDGGDPKR
jgi:AcrR family transcriptional regulator